MREANVMPEDSIDFRIVSPVPVTATDAAKVPPDSPDPPAPDAFARRLHRLEPDPTTLGTEARTPLPLATGVRVIDDSTLDKPDAHALDRVTRHGSGKHPDVVRGINPVKLQWTDGDRAFPPGLEPCPGMGRCPCRAARAGAGGIRSGGRSERAWIVSLMPYRRFSTTELMGRFFG